LIVFLTLVLHKNFLTVKNTRCPVPKMQCIVFQKYIFGKDNARSANAFSPQIHLRDGKGRSHFGINKNSCRNDLMLFIQCYSKAYSKDTSSQC
jgi:hypothetical protein